MGRRVHSAPSTASEKSESFFGTSDLLMVSLLNKNLRHGRGNRRSISATCECCSMRRIMSGRGCVDFFVIFRKQFHRTHNPICWTRLRLLKNWGYRACSRVGKRIKARVGLYMRKIIEATKRPFVTFYGAKLWPQINKHNDQIPGWL